MDRIFYIFLLEPLFAAFNYLNATFPIAGEKAKEINILFATLSCNSKTRIFYSFFSTLTLSTLHIRDQPEVNISERHPVVFGGRWNFAKPRGISNGQQNQEQMAEQLAERSTQLRTRSSSCDIRVADVCKTP